MIDLYQVHWPARHTNYFGHLGYVHDETQVPVAIGETFEALADLVRAGKVRHVGLSNETPWGVMQFLNAAQAAGIARPRSIQNPYSLLNRSFEVGLAEMAIREDVACWLFALGIRGSQRQYLDDSWPAAPGSRFFRNSAAIWLKQGRAATQAYVNIAAQAGLDPAQMALAYVCSRRFVTSTIIGATTMDQLTTNIASAEVRLSADVLQAIEAAHHIHTYSQSVMGSRPILLILALALAISWAAMGRGRGCAVPRMRQAGGQPPRP